MKKEGQKSSSGTLKCPFDANHIMPYDRFLIHLEKCPFPGKSSYRKCKYNPYHVIHLEEIEAHYKSSL
jgi:hypothetical protein